MSNVKVEFFCDSFCPTCSDIETFLKENGVDYDYINVGKDKAAMDKAVSLSNQDKLPVIKIGDQVICPPIDKKKLLDAINS